MEVLSKQKSRRDRLPDAGRTETLSPLPVAELRKYEAVKKAHPDALVCFAQNGYFELYGKDAEKAAPLLGTKLLEKKVRGKPSMPVTGFRESAWVAGSHKLWKSGMDVFLSKDGETFKELKAADYIPVGATLNVDCLLYTSNRPTTSALPASLSQKPSSAARCSEMSLRSTTGNRRQMWHRTRLRRIMTG